MKAYVRQASSGQADGDGCTIRCSDVTEGDRGLPFPAKGWVQSKHVRRVEKTRLEERARIVVVFGCGRVDLRVRFRNGRGVGGWGGWVGGAGR